MLPSSALSTDVLQLAALRMRRGKTRTLDGMQARGSAGILGVLLLQGCIALPIPHERAASPTFYGQVRDAQTGQPVSDAMLTVIAHSPPNQLEEPERPKTTGRTDQKGAFQLGVVEPRTWFVLFLLPAEGTCGGTLFVDHPQYQPALVEVSQFRGAAVNGMCTGFKVERNVVLNRK